MSLQRDECVFVAQCEALHDCIQCDWWMMSSFYRAMHFSAKRGIAIACRLSVCL